MQVLVEEGFPDDTHVVLAGLANSYSSYITTYEEYQASLHVPLRQRQLTCFAYVTSQTCPPKPFKNTLKTFCRSFLAIWTGPTCRRFASTSHPKLTTLTCPQWSPVYSFPPSFIHQVISITGLNKLYDCICSLPEDGLRWRQGVKPPLTHFIFLYISLYILFLYLHFMLCLLSNCCGRDYRCRGTKRPLQSTDPTP